MEKEAEAGKFGKEGGLLLVATAPPDLFCGRVEVGGFPAGACPTARWELWSDANGGLKGGRLLVLEVNETWLE